MPQALPLSLSVPISLVKAGTMPAWHWRSLATFKLSPCRDGRSRLSTGQIWARWDSRELAGTVGRWPQKPGTFNLLRGKKQGQTQEWQQFTASQLETAAMWYAGKRKGLTRLQRYRRRSAGFSVRSWTGTEGSAFPQKAGHTLLSKPHPRVEQLSLTYATEGRTSLPAARASHDKALAPVSDIVIKAIKDPNLF